MDTTGLVLELLKQRGAITPLEQDILDTYHELSRSFLTGNLQYDRLKRTMSITPIFL